ncbi:MAG TPA: 4Fe-4S dicluster domain-containing protein [Candidatus Stackebrandtia faecavium]|nr:4Fe-4S dicluster domain-containing protein [Candidatus Stackebrandtia faecavium]
MDQPAKSRLEELNEIANTCVHCGFCLPVCPTYQLWGQEMDSPRGRIDLMKLSLQGGEVTEAAATHIDRCLGCMACVTACPSGVQYDALLAHARDEVDASAKRSLPQRLARWFIFSTFPHPRRLRLLMRPLAVMRRLGVDRWASRSALLSRFAPRLAAMASLSPPAAMTRGPAGRYPAQGKRRAVVGMLLGCVQRECFPQVNDATVRVLNSYGCEVIAPKGQGCCGALSAHSGRSDEARRHAKRMIAAFEAHDVDAIVVNSAGCGSAMKEYASLLADDANWRRRAQRCSDRVRDLTQYLAELGPTGPRHPVALTVAYHDACHLGHAQRLWQEPRSLLAAVPDLTVREIPNAGDCCGSAGIYNILEPKTARDLGDRKAAKIAQTDARLLVSANPGCAMQIAAAMRRNGSPIPVAHIAEVLDVSIRGGDAAELLDPQGQRPDSR